MDSINNLPEQPTALPSVQPAPCIFLAPPQPADKAANRLGRASFVCGVISIALFGAGIIPGLLGLTMNTDARQRGSNYPNLKNARIMNIIGISLWFAPVVIWLLLLLLSLIFGVFLSAVYGM